MRHWLKHPEARRALLFAAVFAALTLLIELCTPRLTDVQRRSPDGTTQAISVPYHETSTAQLPTDYVIAGQLTRHFFTFRSMRVVADDCVQSIKINGQNVPLEGISRASRCDIFNGFELRVGDHLHWGVNDVEIVVRDLGGSLALRLDRTRSDFVFATLATAWLLTLAVLLFLGLSALGLARSSAVLLILGLFVRFAYLSYTGHDERSHDLIAHMQYVEHVAQEGSLPRSDECFECHQPPLYYYTAAAVYRVAQATAPYYRYYALQCLSLLFFFGFLVLAARFLENILAPDRWRALAIALLVFWPSGILHAPRIGNDTLLYLLFMASLWQLQKWWSASGDEAGARRSLLAAAALAFAAQLTKPTGLLLFAVMGLALALRCLRAPERREFARKHAYAFAAIALGVALFVSPNIRPHEARENGATHLLSKLEWVDKALLLDNHAREFVWIDLATFINEPFINGYDRNLRTDYFWNFFLKTSLFGEWMVRSRAHSAVASVMSALFLVLLAASLYGLFRMRPAELERFFIPLAASALLVAGTLAWRYRVPLAASSDFRLAWPSLLGLLLGLVSALRAFAIRKRPLPVVGLTVASVAFMALSAWFFLMPWLARAHLNWAV